VEQASLSITRHARGAGFSGGILYLGAKGSPLTHSLPSLASPHSPPLPLSPPPTPSLAGFSSGIVYFEVRINYIKLGGYVALCLGAHDMHTNSAVYPVAHYNAFCYTSQGELLRRGAFSEGVAC